MKKKITIKGIYIKTARIEAGYSQIELSEKLSRSRTWLALKESSYNYIEIKENDLLRIADICKIPIEWLTCRDIIYKMFFNNNFLHKM